MSDSLLLAIQRRARDASAATDNAGLSNSIARPVADEQALARAEQSIGQRLPSFLRSVYREVGDGGFGPGYGLLPLLSLGKETREDSVVALYNAFCSVDPEDPAWRWPSTLVPFCDWGCAIRSCVDCSSDEGAVVTFDPNSHELGQPTESALVQTHSTLRGWFSDWIDGVTIWDIMFESGPRTSIINPFTGKAHEIASPRLRKPRVG
jgi:hypothetical protein